MSHETASVSACERPPVGNMFDARSYRAYRPFPGRLTDQSGVQLEREPSMKLVVGTVVLAMLTLSGCSSGSGQASPSSSGVVATPSATPTPTASFEDLASQQALTVIPSYLAAVDKIATDPTVPLNTLYAVASSPEVLIDLRTHGVSRSLGYRQSGSTKVVSSRAMRVDLTSNPKAKPHPIFPTVTTLTCIDVSTVLVTDSRGTRVGVAHRANFFVEHVTISNLHYPSAKGWRVSSITNRGVPSCEGV